MKKRFAKKLALNKKTVSNLNETDLNNIRGGSIVFICTRSCSIVIACCDPHTDEIAENKVEGLG